jgi:hypothetical protein
MMHQRAEAQRKSRSPATEAGAAETGRNVKRCSQKKPLASFYLC